jgi:hypothetical protein
MTDDKRKSTGDSDGDKSNFTERPRRDIDAGRDQGHKITPSRPWPEPAQRKPDPHGE